SHSMTRPFLVRTRSTRPEPSSAATESSRTSSTPFSRWMSASTWPTSSPRTWARGTRVPAIAATSRPSWRSEAATSEPMNPSPITTARCPRWIAARISEGAELEDGLQVCAGYRERSVAPTRGDQKMVVGDVLPPLQLDALLTSVDRRGPNAQPEIDALLGVVISRLDELRLEALLPAEIA